VLLMFASPAPTGRPKWKRDARWRTAGKIKRRLLSRRDTPNGKHARRGIIRLIALKTTGRHQVCARVRASTLRAAHRLPDVRGGDEWYASGSSLLVCCSSFRWSLSLLLPSLRQGLNLTGSDISFSRPTAEVEAWLGVPTTMNVGGWCRGQRRSLCPPLCRMIALSPPSLSHHHYSLSPSLPLAHPPPLTWALRPGPLERPQSGPASFVRARQLPFHLPSLLLHPADRWRSFGRSAVSWYEHEGR